MIVVTTLYYLTFPFPLCSSLLNNSYTRFLYTDYIVIFTKGELLKGSILEVNSALNILYVTLKDFIRGYSG